MNIQLFLPLLVLCACGSQETDELVTGTDPGTSNTPSSGWDKAPEGTEIPDALKDADLPLIGQQQQPRGPKITQAYKPSREPQFHFETDAIADAELKDFYLEMDVKIDNDEIGTMTFVLWGDEAPITVRNFLRYADEGFYDGKIFHRIVRDFMLQGGSSNNTASGQGPNGQIKGEFSRDPARAHRYGVLSMARSPGPDSASSQFFIITDSNAPSVKNLDGQYASFGILHQGISVLEQVADIPTTPNMRGEKSNPTQRAVITELRVKRGKPSIEGEEIKRPPIDLHGEAERIRIQHVLISFAGTRTAATRSKEDAQKLAEEILQRAKDGEDFDSLVQEFSDDPGSKTTDPPGGYALLNRSQYPPEPSEEVKAEIEELNKKLEKLQNDLRAEIHAQTKTLDEAQAEFLATDTAKRMLELQGEFNWTPRDQVVPAFGNIGFGLKVGEVGIAAFDTTTSPYGWHIIRRYQ